MSDRIPDEVFMIPETGEGVRSTPSPSGIRMMGRAEFDEPTMADLYNVGDILTVDNCPEFAVLTSGLLRSGTFSGKVRVTSVGKHEMTIEAVKQ